MTRSPARSRRSRAPQTPAETITRRSAAAMRWGQRVSSKPARSPTGATRTPSRPNARNGRDGRRGNSSSRASARASSSTPVRIRIPLTPLHAGSRVPLGLLPLPALDPGLPAIAGCGVLAGEFDGRDLGVGDGDGPFTRLVEHLDERLGRRRVPVEDVADELAAVGFDHGGIAAVIERELDDLGETQIAADLRHPAF